MPERHGTFAGFLLIAAMVAVPMAPALAANGFAAEAADQAAVDKLVADIRADIGKLSPTASVADIEAAIAFTISQSGQPQAVIALALAKANASYPNTPANKNIKRALANVAAQKGTGGVQAGNNSSINNGSGLSTGTSGTTDYSPRPR